MLFLGAVVHPRITPQSAVHRYICIYDIILRGPAGRKNALVLRVALFVVFSSVYSSFFRKPGHEPHNVGTAEIITRN